MLSRKAIILSVLLIFCVMGTQVFAQNAPPPDTKNNKSLDVKVISVRDGDADYLPAGADAEDDDAWQVLEEGLTLKQGARIATYDKCTVDMRFGDLSLVSISQNSQVTIDQFYYDASTKSIVTDLRILTGNLDVEVEQSDTKADMRIATPNATASVTGTGLSVTSRVSFGDSFGVNRGGINVRSGGSSRNVGQGERTNDRLDATIELVIAATRADVQPQGLTEAELSAFLNGTGSSTILAGDLEGDGNPGFTRIIQQQGNIIIDRPDGGCGFTTPPPEQPKK
ncbi:FecR domain-containing protein [Planctomycetota bacterium]